MAEPEEMDEQVGEDGAEEAPPEEVAEAEAEADAEEDEEEDVDEDLKDAVEGSFRLKRLLSQDDSKGGQKRRRLDAEADPEIQQRLKLLLTRWALSTDNSVRHVLENASVEELQFLIDTKFVPSKTDQRKTPAEFTNQKLNEFRERHLPGGAHLDVLQMFRFRNKLSEADERRLRALTHKDLRYVVENYDGTSSIEDLIAESSGHEPDEDQAAYAMPGAPGAKTMGRFNRLELIDGLADSAVFGDANLSFSVVLARHRAGLGHVGRVIATTFEEIETLRERYKEIDETIKDLEGYDAEVYHGVDCTRIAIDDRFKGMKGQLGAVYYNFPHSGAVGGFFDSHPMVNWRHENLMRLFFRALRSFVKPGGVVKVSSNKGAVGVRYAYIVGSAMENEFVHVETMPFTEWTLHRYGRSYGDRRDQYKRLDAKNNQSYNAQNASNDMVYCFRYEPSGNAIGKQSVRPPPTLKALKECKDGPFQKLANVAARHKLAEELHARFVKEVTGTHVG
eukprot:TRINITY_DN531_c0_g1_i1.p1 TRINITY_DN531_c0_g1~~TRINITY_DN531_c0_g1_i1.p1  ORF type:complete len:506 (-),score=137.78 TRINITY_DN531_c0_g1_i1:142-1659(-)